MVFQSLFSLAFATIITNPELEIDSFIKELCLPGSKSKPQNKLATAKMQAQ